MHSTFRCRLAIAAVWSLLLIVLPRISHGSESDIALKNFGAVSGRVVDENTGLPIAFADVTLHHETFGASAVADETGHYVVTGLPADDFYYATAFSSGYVRENFDDRPCPSTPIGCNPFLGDPISVQADTTTTGIDFDLEPLGSIAGRVTHTATGLPLPSIEIHVIDLFGSVVAIGSTDADGVYSVGGLETGNYFARTQNFAGYVEEVYDNVLCDRLTHCDPFTSGGTMIPVQINATTPGIDFSLDLGGRIEGTVTAAGSGEPLGFGITVWTLGGQMVDTVSADENGHYVVQGLETGSFRLTAGGFGVQSELYDNIPCPPGYETCDLSLGTPVPVTIESVTAGIDFVLDRLGGIIGTVTSAATGLPIPHTVVEVWDTTGFSPVSTQADEQGNYQLDPLPPGTYFVTAEEDRYFEQVFDGLPCPDPGFDCDPTTGTPIAVALNTIVSGIDFALTRRPAGNIAGTVRSEVNGDLLANVNIDVWDESGSPVAFASTDGGGNYLVVDVPAGSFVVTARATGVFVDELYDDLPCPDLSCDLSTGTPVLVADEVTTTGIDFDLTRLGSIAGTVIDSLIGEPVDLFVRAWNDAGEFAGDSDIGPFGGYEIAGLSPGTYFVDTIDNGAFRDELYDNLPCPNSACDPTTGTPIAVALNSPVTGIDFVLDLDQGLAGRVVREDTGLPLGLVSIFLWDQNGNFVTDTLTNANGEYRFAVLPGTYFVTSDAFLEPFLIDELYDDRPCPAFQCDPTLGTPVPVAAGAVNLGIDFALAPATGTCIPSPTSLCLAGGRFRVEVEWEDFQGALGFGVGEELTDATGTFWFFSQDNIEVIVKVLDACVEPFNHFWVFAAGLTNVGAELTVNDTLTGELRTYNNTLGNAFEPVQDTSAFATCEAGGSAGMTTESGARLAHQTRLELERELEVLRAGRASTASVAPVDPATKQGTCTPTATSLCLAQGRFRVESTWKTPAGEEGSGQAVLLSDATGYFWFFSQDNVEALVKVLDACSLPGFENFWVFAAGLTDVEVEIVVTDTVSGEVREYSNPQSTPFQPVQDTDAFDTCPGNE